MDVPVHLEGFTLNDFVVELFVPDAAFMRQAYKAGAIPFPYWSQVWPSAKALATFLVQQPAFTHNKKVVELGAGLGLPSLIAARNALDVLCADYVPEAVDIAAKSAAHAGLSNFTASVVDWQRLPPGIAADVLLLSDVNYAPESFATLLALVQTFLAKGSLVLISTPQRLMAKDFVAPLLVHCTMQEEVTVMHNGEIVAITILVLEKRKDR